MGWGGGTWWGKLGVAGGGEVGGEVGGGGGGQQLGPSDVKPGPRELVGSFMLGRELSALLVLVTSGAY